MAQQKTKEIKISVPEELFNVFFPSKTMKHFNNARKEMLLAFRSLIDARIEALEQQEGKKEEKKETQKKKIKVE
ncbi:hypothetical protein KGY73_11390 [bacterium]|nr:hypothetical protein [bacterium]